MNVEIDGAQEVPAGTIVKRAVELIINIPENTITVEHAEAIRDVIHERLRQVIKEKFGVGDDDLYQNRELEKAAACYAAYAAMDEEFRTTHTIAPDEWPFAAEWWKPTTPEGDLIKSAALSIAALEARYRTAARKADRPT